MSLYLANLWSVLALLTWIPMERWFPLHAVHRSARSWLSGIARFVSVTAVVEATAWIGSAIVFLPLRRLSPLALSARSHEVLPEFAATVFEVGVGLVLFDFGTYVYHRAAHKVPWLWKLHRVHHSVQNLDALAAYHQHPLDLALLTVSGNLVLALAGISLEGYVAILFLLRLHTVFLHSNVAVGRSWMDGVLAMPRFHHRHHAQGQAPSNFSTFFPLFDRLLRTHA